MSKAKLKKYLQTLPQEHLLQVILDLYDARKEAKEYLEFFMEPDTDAALEKAGKELFRNYFNSKGKPKSKASVKEGNEIVNNFIRLGVSSEQAACMLLLHVESMISYLVMRRIVREGAWDSVLTAFRKAADHIANHHLKKENERRIEKILGYADYAPSYLEVGRRMKEILSEADLYDEDE